MNSTKTNHPWIRYWIFLICLVISAPHVKASEIDKPAPKEQVLSPIQKPAKPYKSPNTALLLSLGITLGSVGLGLGFISSDSGPGAIIVVPGLGLTFGPSAGHFYSGEIARGILTSLGRGAALVAVTLGGLMKISSHGNDSSEASGVLFVGGGLAYVGLALWDIIDAPSSAKRFNEKAAQQHLALTPLIMPSQDPAKSSSNFYGLSLSGTF